MFPDDFIERLKTQEYIDSDSLLEALEQPSPVSIFLNRNKWNHAPENSDKVPWCKNGYYLGSRPSYTLDPLFHAGCYYPKEASGMFLDTVFEYFLKKVENLRVLDLCASPGGKSIQISDIIGKGSFLVSNEVIRSRVSVLNETISKWGRGNTIVTQNDASAFRKLEGYFDVIVVDAPCSGEGMFRNATAIKEWSVENTELCAARQKRILMDIWPALRQNGLLVYSTCTFNPAENEENILWLSQQDDIESMRIDVSSFEGITEIVTSDIYGYAFYPGRVAGEGFFLSVARKTSPQNTIRKKEQKRAGMPSADEIAAAQRWTTFPKETYFKKNNYLISGACSTDEYEYLSRNLNIIKGGTLVSTIMKNDYLPSHELAMSQFLKEDSFPCLDSGYETAMNYLGRRDVKPADNERGWNLVKYKDVSLGFVKNIGSRLNNYYPVEWRVRMDIPQNVDERIIKWKPE